VNIEKTDPPSRQGGRTRKHKKENSFYNSASGHESQKGLDTKNYRLADRQSQGDFDFDFDVSHSDQEIAKRPYISAVMV
jgi:hypothetical protein